MARLDLHKTAVFLFIACIMHFPVSAQKRTFDSKKHADTLLNKSLLNPTHVKGRKTQKSIVYNSPFSSNTQSVNTILPSKRAKRINTKTYYSKETGLAKFISVTNNANSRKEIVTDKTKACFDFLNEISDLTKIKKPEQDLGLINSETEQNGKTHFRLQQKYKGIKIHGSEVLVHLDESGNGEMFNGNHRLINKDVNTQPSISPTKAIETTVADLSKKTVYRELNDVEKTLLEYNGPIVDTIIYEDKSVIGTFLLAYHVTIRPNNADEWEYFINAKTGDILKGYKNSCHVDGPATTQASDLNNVTRTVNSYLTGNTYSMKDASKPMANITNNIGFILTYDAKNTYGNSFSFSPITSNNNTWTNKTAVSAHYNAGVAYNYYNTVHQRNSIDGKGGNVISVINVADEYGRSLENAYWNGKYMSYGNGGTSFKPLAGATDVAGHELTHGVVQFTANLEYYAQSGAINESMADIFGCMMDTTDWLMGEDVVKTSAFPTGALRSLSDPHNGGSNVFNSGWQPKNMNEYVSGPVLDNFGNRDNEGVHINSGIPNYAYYLYATAINSKYRASKVFYRALTFYLTSTAQFIDLRLAVIQSAIDLYGSSSKEATEAALAFDAVGIKDGVASNVTDELPTNPGTEYLLSTDVDNTNINGLYRTTPNGTNFQALLGKTLYNKPSVTDNGEMCYYVGIDKRIYSINTNPSKPLNKQVFDESPIWSNVAISKDGKRLAGVTYDADTSIYIYDLTTNQLARFELYNPTFSQGVKSEGPIYADGLEWSYDGEYLVYDCFNSIPNSGSANLEYWDINIIKVWDNTLNGFSSGEIFKLFNNLSEGESIGNPTFSKKSPNILAFDYTYDYTNQYYVVGLDTDKNDLNIISANNSLGWPSYNKTDTRLAFTTSGMFTDYDISYVTLNSDKISSDYNDIPLVDNAKWPVYYAVGARDITSGIEEEDALQIDTRIFPNPTTGALNIELSADDIGATLEIYDNLGQKIYSKKISETSILHDLSSSAAGIYSICIKGESNTKRLKVIKQ